MEYFQFFVKIIFEKLYFFFLLQETAECDIKSKCLRHFNHPKQERKSVLWRESREREDIKKRTKENTKKSKERRYKKEKERRCKQRKKEDAKKGKERRYKESEREKI